MKGKVKPEPMLGDLLQDVVNRVSHRGGQTLAIMNDASVTLHHILLLSRISESGGNTSSELSTVLSMSLPSVSQMIDRLYQLHLVSRTEMSEDRRKKRITLTDKGRKLLQRLHSARSAEYEAGVARLSEQLRADLRLVLSRTLLELEREVQSA
jgi:DNA-binding MarR family transcriptional regulator